LTTEKRLFYFTFLVVATGIFFIYKAQIRQNIQFPTNIDIKVGDLVFRHGTGSDSDFIRYLSKCEYTHVGMVVQINPVLIVHATTDDDKHRQNQVIISSLVEFAALSKKIAITRLQTLTDNDRLKIADSLRQRIGENFVLQNADEKNLYCTTLLEQEISKAVVFKPHYTGIDIPVFKGLYLFPKAFLECKQNKIVYTQDISSHTLQY
jgi:hypothetical protein